MGIVNENMDMEVDMDIDALSDTPSIHPDTPPISDDDDDIAQSLVNMEKEEEYKCALHIKMIDKIALDTLDEDSLENINQIAFRILSQCQEPKRMRSIAYNLKTNALLRTKLVNNTITAEELIRLDTMELAPNELKEERKKNERLSFKNKIIAEPLDVLKRNSYKKMYRKHLARQLSDNVHNWNL